jgi:hypothetical protein
LSLALRNAPPRVPLQGYVCRKPYPHS